MWCQYIFLGILLHISLKDQKNIHINKLRHALCSEQRNSIASQSPLHQPVCILHHPQIYLLECASPPQQPGDGKGHDLSSASKMKLHRQTSRRSFDFPEHEGRCVGTSGKGEGMATHE